MNILLDGIYYHTAWADDDEGTNFSLTEYADAVYIGTYQDDSSTDSTDYTDYTWQVIGEDEVEDVENEADLYEDVAVSEVADAVEDADEDAASLRAHVIENDANIQGSQQAQDEGIGNPNELVGTNQGTSNWSASSGVTLSEVTGTIYDENEEPIKYMVAEITTGSGNWISYNADALVSIIANQEDDNVHTLSADVNLSSVVDIPVTLSDGGANTLLDFGIIDNEPTEDTLDNDGVWVYNKSTASVSDEVADIGQVLYFDLSNMSTGDTISIANLKIEAGALATPWRASLDEVRTMAAEAQRIAEGVNEHFWYNSTGAHVTEVTQEEYEQSPSTAGGNVLITSQGMAVRDGTTELASFSGSQAQVGESGSGHTIITPQGLMIYGGTGQYQLALIGYGEGVNQQGQTVLAPYFSLGDRAPNSVIGNYSMAEGTGNTAEGFCAHAEGYRTTANHIAHAEGESTTANGDRAHAEGQSTTADGVASHTEGYGSIAEGDYSHAEGVDCTAEGVCSHAEGNKTWAYGDVSHAEGDGTIASTTAQHVSGKYNLEDTSGDYAFIVGNGVSDSNRSNAITIDWNGNIEDGNGNPYDKPSKATTGNWVIRDNSDGHFTAWYTGTATGTFTQWTSSSILYYKDISAPTLPFTPSQILEAGATKWQVGGVTAWVSYLSSGTMRFLSAHTNTTTSRTFNYTYKVEGYR